MHRMCNLNDLYVKIKLKFTFYNIIINLTFKIIIIFIKDNPIYNDIFTIINTLY